MPGAPAPNPALPPCPQGISAVKAIALAAAQGQRIYTITPQVYNDNPGIVANQLAAHSQGTRQKVQSYLEAGFEVSIHQSPITQDGWTGAGYTAIDPQTGVGGYFIEGGMNGGALSLFSDSIGFAFGALSAGLQTIVLMQGFLLWATIILAAVLVVATQIIIIELAGADPMSVNSAKSIIFLTATFMVSVGLISFGLAMPLSMALFGFLMSAMFPSHK